MKGSILKLGLIPEQFTAKAHPALFEGQKGEREGKKLRNTFQRLRPEEFSSRDFGLRSFRRLEISACAEISYISGRKLHIFQRVLGPGEMEGEEVGEGRGGQNWNEI